MQAEGAAKRHLICAIITPNYLRPLLILGESLAISMPSADLRVLILQDCSEIGPIQEAIDAYLDRTNSIANHRAITIDDCDWGDFDVESAVLFYDILEFATSVKPALMRSFLRAGWQRVTYLDPDIQVFRDFTNLLDDDADLTLTPHFLSDIPKDEFKPSTHDILLAGFFNLGFCSTRPSALPFLDWWSDRLQFECLNDHLEGFFTDQKLVDLATLKANTQVLKDPGCNVAYWNLHERRIVGEDGRWAVNVDGATNPLYFFHFSGFQIDQNPSLSVHATRKVLGDAIPRAFAAQYELQLLSPDVPSEPYSFTLGGTSLQSPVPSSWHTTIREDLEIHTRAGLTLREVRESVYQPMDLARWSTCLSCGVDHVNFGARARSFLAGWACHPSLEGVPNAISANFRTPFFEFRASPMQQLAWASSSLARELVGNEELATEILHTAGEALRNAVNLKIVGYFTYPAGIGQVARWALRRMELAGIYPAIDRVYAVRDSPEYLSAVLRRRNPLAASNASALCFVNADQWQAHVRNPGRVNFRTQHVEAVWAWELEEIPPLMYDVAASREIERVHALSNWSARAMAKVLPVPVQRLAPFGVDLFDLSTPKADRASGPRLRPHYILTSLDAKSYLSRKNPEGVLRLWGRVQRDYPEHWLVVKSVDLRDFASPELLDLIDSTPRTLLVDEYVEDGAYLDLLYNCDVFVSLHRSEGMGLAPIEAGLLGKPVVYTNYGGVVDFLDDGFFPVSHTMVRVGDSLHDTGPYDSDALWAEPDLDDADRQLRRALELTKSSDPSSLTLDQKQLVEHLITAQGEVVATAQRLLSQTKMQEKIDLLPMVFELFAMPLEEIIEPLAPMPTIIPNANPVLYGMVAGLWWVYKILPRRLRFQLNIALIQLRGRHHED